MNKDYDGIGLTKKERFLQLFTYFCLAFAFVSTITNMIYTILNSSNLANQIISVIGVILLSIFSVLYLVMGMFASSKKAKIFVIIGSIILASYSLIQVIVGIIPKDLVPDFTGKDIKEVVSWANDRNILVEQEFENSDSVSKYMIISQDVKEGTSTKKLKKLKVIVSDGINVNKETDVTNMVGWKLDDVVKFIDDNHLTNVTIKFEFNDNVDKDIIFEQSVIAVIKRNEPVTLKSSLGKEKELKSTTLDNLVGKDLFHALVYLGRNNLKYKIEYAYSDDDEDIVLKQSISKWTVISPNDNDVITLTVSRKDNITVLDFSNMSANEITNWATNNRLKVEFSYEYDEKIKEGKVVSYTPGKDSSIKVGATIKVVISKGQIYMIDFTNVEDFISWANDNNITYTIDYKFSNTVEKGKLISSTHNIRQLIKNNDTIKLVVSQGGNSIVPNLLGMSYDDAVNSCSKANIICKFIYQNDDKTGVVVKQSMRSGSNVPNNTTVTVTIGKGD